MVNLANNSCLKWTKKELKSTNLQLIPDFLLLGFVNIPLNAFIS